MSLISQLYRKKENISSKIHDKLKIRKNKSQSTSSERHIFQENKSKYSINILYRKRINNSIDNLKGSINKNKNKINNKKNNNSENYLYKNLISLYPFYYLDYNDLKYNLNDIIYFSDDSTLYKGKYFHNDVCIKEIKNINYLSEKELDIIQNEIDISLKLHHKNIINTLGYSFNSNYTKIFIISEYMKNKSLKSFIDSNKGNIPLKQKLLFIFEISLAIEYMHTRKYKILHRDIKSSNILLDDNLHCKLCDFGMSKYYKNENATKSKNEEVNNNSINNYQTNSQSTLFWMSPEYLCDGIINEKSDIYSFGILIWEIFMEETNPYKNININDYILGNKEIVYNKRPIINDEYFKECPKIKELICLMWNNDYNKRPNIESILNLLEDLNNQYSFL